jgi:DNA-binding response OmpR family regulator
MSRILVVDDNQLVSNMLHEFLTSHGFDVMLAHDANEGYSRAIDFHPDLILCDVQLPDVVGFELVRVIKNRPELRHVPIIMITGTAHSAQEKVKGFQLGADDYILKPFEMSELLERLRAVLRRTQAVASPVGGPASSSNVYAEPKLEPVVPSSHANGSTKSKKKLAPLDVGILAFVDPHHLPVEDYPPAISRAFLTAALLFIAGSFLFAEGAKQSPLLISLSIPMVWGLLVSLVVMSCSIIGVPMGWREGARIVSISGLPWLFKMFGALIFSMFTTLSPFDFVTGPAILSEKMPAFFNRLDLFELASYYILFVILKRRQGSSRSKALIVVIIVWIAPVVLTLLSARMAS